MAEITLKKFKELTEPLLLRFPDSDLQIVKTDSGFDFVEVPKTEEQNKLIDPVE